MVASTERNQALVSPIEAILKAKRNEIQKLQAGPDFAEASEEELMAAMLSNPKLKTQVTDIWRNAVDNARVMREGEELTLQEAFVDDTSRTLISRGISQLATKYENVPAVLNALDSLMTAKGGLIKSSLNDTTSLLNEMATLTAQLRADGKIDDATNLGSDMRNYMANPETYQQNADLFAISSPMGAGINKFVFGNNMKDFTSGGMQRSWARGKNEEQRVQEEAARLGQAEVTPETEEIQQLQRELEGTGLSRRETEGRQQRLDILQRAAKERRRLQL